jgi:hypothetical protein
VLGSLGRRVPEAERKAEEQAQRSAQLEAEAAEAAARAAQLEEPLARAERLARDRQLALESEEARARRVAYEADARVANADVRARSIDAFAKAEVAAAERALEEAQSRKAEAAGALSAVTAAAEQAGQAAEAARAEAEAAVTAAKAAAEEARAKAAQDTTGADTAARRAQEAEEAATARALDARSEHDAAVTDASNRRALAASALADADRARQLAERERQRAEAEARARRNRPRITLGGFPAVAAIVAVGLAVCSVADALSRATLAPSEWFFWLGVALIVAPVVYRLCSADASAGERLAIVCLFGLSLYAVKTMRDPFGFTMPDEFYHVYNAQQIALHHRLFQPDIGLPVTRSFPGLEGVTNALMSLTGMSPFGAGLIVVAAARLTLMVGLFVLFSRLSGSARVAGLGAAAYAGNSNFVLWGSQYAYESLALPLLVVLLALIAERKGLSDTERRMWALPVVLVMVSIVVTHHLTSYLMDLLLVVFVLIPLIARKRTDSIKVWPFAALSLVLTIGWLVVVASETVGYISPVVNHAFTETLKTLLGESSPRTPFEAGHGTLGTPVSERIVAFAALGILFVALPFGLLAVWRRHRRDPMALVLCLGALGFFGVLGLRLAPSAWEVGNRMSEFLFIGLAFVVGYAVVEHVLPRIRWRITPALVTILFAVVVVGGAVTGWPTDATLAAPTKIVAASGQDISSEAMTLGKWVGAHLAQGTFAAPESDSRTILVSGDGSVLTGPVANIDTILSTPGLLSSQLATLRRRGVRYVVVDLRQQAGDNTRGYGFSVTSAGGTPDKLLPQSVRSKFDNLPAARLYDSGNVFVYDLQGTG